MSTVADHGIVRAARIPWQDRRNIDNWPSRAGLYLDVPECELCLRLIDYPLGATEPRHVHDGSHATTVLKGTALIDGVTLGPLDVILGPGGEPHGPLHYPQGCQLFSAFQGSYHHSEVQQLSGESRYRLVRQETIAWQARSGGREAKTLIDQGCGRLLLELMRMPAGYLAEGHRHGRMQALLVVEGSLVTEGETLGEWDLFWVGAGGAHQQIEFPRGATLLSVTMR